MKVKHLFFAAIAAVFTFAACQEKIEDLGEPNIDLSTTTLAFEQGAGVEMITLNSTRSWKAVDVADWLVVNPAKGPASKEDQQVTIEVLENTGANRSCTIKFTCGIDNEYLTVNQKGPQGGPEKGDGTKEHPYLASQARELALSLESEAEDGPYYIKGYVKKFASKHESSMEEFKNALFYITDTKEGGDEDFYCYQVYYLGGKKFSSLDQIALEDEVVVYGKITNYNGTPETVGKGAAYIYSLNGETGDDPQPAKVVDATVSQVISEQNTDVIYRLSGTVSGFSSQYCSFDLTDETGKIYVFSVDQATKDEYSSKLANGDTVTIEGQYEYYEKKSQHEIVNAKITAWTPGKGAEVVDATVSQVITEQKTDVIYRLSGTVSGFSSKYCSFDLTDETGKIYVFSVDQATKEEYSSKLANGDTVTIEGEYKFFADKSQHEIVNAKITAWTPGQGGDDPQPVEVVDATVSQVITEQKTEVIYRLSGTVSGFSSKYCSFDLADETGKIYVYSVDQATKEEYSSKLANGDTVTIEGEYKFFADKSQHEIVNAKITAWTSGQGGEGGDEGGEGGSDPVDPSTLSQISCAEFNALSESDENWYILEGKVVSIPDTQNGNINLQDESGESSYIFGLSGKDGEKYPTLGIEKGDVIKIYGQHTIYVDYNNAKTVEMKSAKLLNLTKGEKETVEAVVTLTFPDDDGAKNGYAGYDKAWTAKSGTYSFTMTEFNNNKWNSDWKFVRCGRKQDSVASIATVNAIDEAVSKVIVSIDKYDKSHVKSVNLVVARDAKFTDVVETVALDAGLGDIEAAVASPAAGLYYKLVFNCLKSDANGFVQVSKLVFAK